MFASYTFLNCDPPYNILTEEEYYIMIMDKQRLCNQLNSNFFGYRIVIDKQYAASSSEFTRCKKYR